MIIGVDFGTTNTSAAQFDGQEIHLLPVDPSSASNISRTAIYLTRSGDYILGNAALNLYFEQNVGRPTRYRKIWVGEILQVFAELPAFYRDVYVYEDEFSPGRLFLSIKTAMRNQSYYGTVFQESWYSPSDLAAVYLLGMKRNIEKHLKAPIREVVLGRPVHFSTDPTEDKVAQSRLVNAAFKAGFEKVYLEYEPVAAALAYERKIHDKQVVLVFDFGGGTLDFTVMEIGIPAERRVLATGGIPIGGDIFDQRLFRATIPPHLGEGDYFIAEGRQFPIPAHIFDLLTTPQEVVALNTPQNQEMLRLIHAGAMNKHKTHALLQIVSSNYALLMFDLIERAKRQLSSQTDTRFRFEAETFAIEETITRKRFERAIQNEYEAIFASMMDTIDRAGVQVRDIQRVIRTGGSSQIPLFSRMLHRTFGYNRVEEIDIFSSVTSGLAIRGQEIARSLTRDSVLPAYTPDSFRPTEEISPEGSRNLGIAEVDLDDVFRRLEVQQEFRSGEVSLPTEIIIAANDQAASAFPLPAEDEATLRPFPWDQHTCAARVPSSALLLFAANTFKLVSSDARSVYMAQQIGPEAIRDLLHLDSGEFITALTAWQPDDPPQRFICLVTRYAQARCFDARLLAEQILKRPYFELERRYVGFPIFMLPMEEDCTLVAGTNLGRVARASVREMTILVHDLLKMRGAEELTAAVAVREEDPVLAVSQDARLLAFLPGSLPVRVPPAGRGQALRRNFPIAGLISLEQAFVQGLELLTSLGRRLTLPVPPAFRADLDQPPIAAARLQPGETIVAVLNSSAS